MCVKLTEECKKVSGTLGGFSQNLQVQCSSVQWTAAKARCSRGQRSSVRSTVAMETTEWSRNRQAMEHSGKGTAASVHSVS